MNKIIILIVFLVFVLPWSVFAGPSNLTYQGRIVRADGIPFEHDNVSFVFQILNPSGSCVIYQEQVLGYNMVNSKGVFDVPIGKGTIQFPLNVGAVVLDAFDNEKTFTCGVCSSSGGTYSCANGATNYVPLVDDNRVLRVHFYDGSGWKTISPDNVIRSVPFAGYSLSAQKLGNNVASDFLTKVGLPTCGVGEFLNWNGSAMACISAGAGSYVTTLAGDVTSSGFSSGTVNTTIANGAVSNLSKVVATPGSAGPNRLLATDSTAGTTIKDFYCSTIGSVLKWTGTSGFGCATLSSSDIPNFNSDVDARISAQKGVANGLATLNSSSKIPATQLGTGSADSTTYLRGDGTWNVLSTSDSTKLPLAGGTMSGDINMNGRKVLNASNVGVGTATPSESIETTGNVKAVGYISTSDRRLKKNIQTSQGLNLILKLRGVRYQWKSNDTTDTGLIAQEVEEVMPEAVVTDSRSGYKAVKYQNMISPLIESTKELYGMCKSAEVKTQRELASLRAENAQLNLKVEKLEERLRNLESLVFQQAK